MSTKLTICKNEYLWVIYVLSDVQTMKQILKLVWQNLFFSNSIWYTFKYSKGVMKSQIGRKILWTEFALFSNTKCCGTPISVTSYYSWFYQNTEALAARFVFIFTADKIAFRLSCLLSWKWQRGKFVSLCQFTYSKIKYILQNEQNNSTTPKRITYDSFVKFQLCLIAYLSLSLISNGDEGLNLKGATRGSSEN